MVKALRVGQDLPPTDSVYFKIGQKKWKTIVDFRITDTLSTHNHPPKSPLSGGLRKLRAGQSCPFRDQDW